jgi:predicted transport protein
MSDIKLFDISNKSATLLEGKSVALEKSLQSLMENNLESLVGVTFLETEYSTGTSIRGRIDTLGIDENGCPVIIEYKRSSNENVINQGLFYLDWLLDHKAEFELIILKKLGQEKSEQIDWTGTRVLCIAGGFNKYDSHAVTQINRNIELIRYQVFDNKLLILELVNRVTATGIGDPKSVNGNSSPTKYTTVSEYLEKADQELTNRFEELRSYLNGLGDDVLENIKKFYFGFRRIKNFACVELRVSTGELLIYLKVCPDEISLEEGFTKDVREIGHYGTGDLEVRLKTREDFERAKPLFEKSYEVS